MSISRALLSLTAIACLLGVAFVQKKVESPVDKMVTAAEKFLATLKPEQKNKATFPFNDKERTNWHFIPMQMGTKSTRKGLGLEQMTPKQKKAALAILRAGTSDQGFSQATTIMSLEAILHELEKGGRMVRNPEWYFVSIFGEPSKTGKWGWRIEGHHLSINFTIENGKVTSATPAFFGSNPAIIAKGPRKGYQTLPDCENLARELFGTLTDEQKKAAYREKHFPEIEQGKAAPTVGAPHGLPASKMTEKQQAVLRKLIRAYAKRMPPAVAADQLEKIKNAGFDKIHLAYSQTKSAKRSPITYRVQGPTFLIEFLNTQRDSLGNPANHVHSIWRNIKGDFGLVKR